MARATGIGGVFVKSPDPQRLRDWYLMGPGGCGKSSSLHLLGGLDRSAAGQLLFDRDPIADVSEAEWARRRRNDARRGRIAR